MRAVSSVSASPAAAGAGAVQPGEPHIAGAEIRLGVDATVDLILDHHPDVVVLATGARPGIPDVPGIEQSPAVDAFTVLARPAASVRRALVVTRPMVPGSALAEALEALRRGPAVFQVGDCVVPRTAFEAMQDAAALGLHVEGRQLVDAPERGHPEVGEPGVVVAPSDDGGTSALGLRPPDVIAPAFNGASGERHVRVVDIDQARDVALRRAKISHVVVEARDRSSPRQAARLRRDDHDTELLAKSKRRAQVVGPAAEAVQEVRGALRAPAPGPVGLELARLVDQGLNDPPGLLDHVLPREALLDPVQRVAQEALVGTGLVPELALEEHAIDAVKADLDRFDALIADNPDLQRLVRSPVFTAEEQTKALFAVLNMAGVGGLARISGG